MAKAFAAERQRQIFGVTKLGEFAHDRELGLRVAAISCITNLAAGLGKNPLSHDEVLETSARAGKLGAQLLAEFAKRYDRR